MIRAHEIKEGDKIQFIVLETGDIELDQSDLAKITSNLISDVQVAASIVVHRELFNDVGSGQKEVYSVETMAIFERKDGNKLNKRDLDKIIETRMTGITPDREFWYLGVRIEDISVRILFENARLYGGKITSARADKKKCDADISIQLNKGEKRPREWFINGINKPLKEIEYMFNTSTYYNFNDDKRRKLAEEMLAKDVNYIVFTLDVNGILEKLKKYGIIIDAI